MICFIAVFKRSKL